MWEGSLVMLEAFDALLESLVSLVNYCLSCKINPHWCRSAFGKRDKKEREQTRWCPQKICHSFSCLFSLTFTGKEKKNWWPATHDLLFLLVNGNYMKKICFINLTKLTLGNLWCPCEDVFPSWYLVSVVCVPVLEDVIARSFPFSFRTHLVWCVLKLFLFIGFKIYNIFVINCHYLSTTLVSLAFLILSYEGDWLLCQWYEC